MIISFLLKARDKKYKKKRNKEIEKQFPSSVVSIYAYWDDKTILEGENVINSYVGIASSYVGLCTVIGSETNLSRCKIGRFCSIAGNVHVQSYTHPSNFVSSYPGFFNTCNNYPFGKGTFSFNECLTTESGWEAEIGNDVWIGENVIIRGGVKIGDGAIVGMGAVVTKDVPPYAIVGGVPAKIIRYRFDEDTIKKLISISWWNWELDKIKELKEEFIDTANFVKKYGTL